MRWYWLYLFGILQRCIMCSYSFLTLVNCFLNSISRLFLLRWYLLGYLLGPAFFLPVYALLLHSILKKLVWIRLYLIDCCGLDKYTWIPWIIEEVWQVLYGSFQTTGCHVRNNPMPTDEANPIEQEIFIRGFLAQFCCWWSVVTEKKQKLWTHFFKFGHTFFKFGNTFFKFGHTFWSLDIFFFKL
jgi:hypothetical protein